MSQQDMILPEGWDGYGSPSVPASYVLANLWNSYLGLPEAQESVVSVKKFGAVGDGVTDDTAPFQSALASGQSLYLPEGTYRITSTLRMMTTRQAIVGAGRNARLNLHGGAQVVLGEATGSTGAKTGTKIVAPALINFRVEAQVGHVGAIVQIDFADDVYMANFQATLAGYTALSGAYATALKIRWCQWFDAFGCHFMANKYGVHLSVEDRSSYNEGHWSFFGGRISIEKAVEAGVRSANVCQEMLRSGSAPIHTVFYNVHFYNNSTGQARADKSGILFKTGLVGTCLYTNYKPLTVRDGEFESCGKVVDFGSESSATATGRCAIDGIEVLNPDYIGYGLDATKTSAEVGRLYVDNDLTAGHAAFEGCGVLPLQAAVAPIGDTVLPATVINSNHHLLGLRDASGRRSMRPLRQLVLAGAQQVDVTHTLDYTPDIVFVAPSWRTAWNVTNLAATTFRVEFGTAPNSNSNIYCWPLKAPNYLENTTAAGTLLAQVKTANYTIVRADNARTVTHSSGTAHTFTIGASTTLGQDFHCRIANIGAGVLTLTVAGVGDVTLAQNEMREVYYGGATGLIAQVTAARTTSAMS